MSSGKKKKKKVVKKKVVTVTGKNGGKIKTTVGSNTYNTLIKNGGKVSSSSSSSSSGSSSSSSNKSVAQQVADISAQAKKIQDAINTSKLTSKERDQIGSSIQKATGAVSTLVKSDNVAKATGGIGSTGINYALPKAQAPVNPAAITPGMEPVQTPEITPETPGIIDAVGGVTGLGVENQRMSDYMKKQDEARVKREQEQQKTQQTLLEKFLGKNGENVTSPSEARQNAWDETGIDVEKYFAKQEAGIKEIESLTNDYNAVEAARDQQIAQSNDKMASMNFINNQTAQIERNAAPKLNEISANINAKAATLQAQQGNYAEARSYVNDAVQAATADAKFKFDMFSTFYEINKDNFDRVESIYSDAFKNQMAIAQQDYEVQLAEKQMIGEYMLKYPTAGLSMNDSLSDASRKLGDIGVGIQGADLTADQRNFLFAQENPAFADFMGKASDSDMNTLNSYAEGLLNGDMEITNIPEKYRAAAYALSNKMAQELLNPVEPVKETTISAPTGTYSSSSLNQGPTLTSIWNSLTSNLFGD